MRNRGHRRGRVVLWLLLPPLVWVASFTGGWSAAVLVEAQGVEGSSPLWILLGGLIGSMAGLALWLAVMWRLRRRDTKSAHQASLQ